MVRRRIFKITLLGDEGVGKATFRQRYLGHGFRQSYGKIIGANFAVKKLMNYLDEVIIAQIWEILPQHKFSYIREVYYRGSTGVILMFDITRPGTLDNLYTWVQEFRKFNNNIIVPLFVVGSKADLRENSDSSVSVEEAQNFVKTMSEKLKTYICYFETSIKETAEIEIVFKSFIDNITNFLLFSDSDVNQEIHAFLEKHQQELVHQNPNYLNDDKLFVAKYITNIDPELLAKLERLSQSLGVDTSILLDQIIRDFFNQ